MKDTLHFDAQFRLKAGIEKVAKAVGQTAWNKGLKTSAETRKKQSLARMGKSPWNKGLKGVMKPNRGSFKKGVSVSVSTQFTSDRTKGEKNFKWKGDEVGYNALHFWIRDNFGKPNECEHCLDSSKNPRSYQWANKTGEYKRDRDDWLRLCASCHKKYDLKNKK